MQDTNSIEITDEDLLVRMRLLRGRLVTDVQATKDQLNQLTDWRRMVKSALLPSIGLAAAAGYLLVPARQPHHTLDAKQLERLTNRHPVIVTKEEKAGGTLLGTLLAIAGAGAARAASAYVGNKVGSKLDNALHNNTRWDGNKP